MTEPQMGSYPVRRKLPVSYSTEIGRIITRYAYIEMMLREIAYILLKIGPKQGRVAVRQPNQIAEKITMIQDLSKLSKIDLGVNWPTLKNNAKEVEFYRNNLAHNVWLHHGNSRTPTLQTFSKAYTKGGNLPERPKINPLGIEVKLEHLREIRKNIDSLGDVLNVIKGRAETRTPKP